MHLDVMGGGVVFHIVFGMITVTQFPSNLQLALSYAIGDPVKPHVHCLGALEFGLSVGKALCHGVIGGHAGWAQLLPSQFLENVSEDHCLLPVVEQGANLSLRCSSNNVLEDT